MAISGEDLDSQHSLNSERTFTLSSPSQKLWLSSQETEPDNKEDYKMNRETVFCDDIKTEVTYDGDSVILNREVFQQILPVRKKPGMELGKLGIAGILPDFPENWDFKAGITGN